MDRTQGKLFIGTNSTPRLGALIQWKRSRLPGNTRRQVGSTGKTRSLQCDRNPSKNLPGTDLHATGMATREHSDYGPQSSKEKLEDPLLVETTLH